MKTLSPTKFIFLLLFALSLTANGQSAPRVSKVEPPSWWANHTLNPVRLLVRGNGFQDSKVAPKSARFKVSNVRVNARGDYLFFDVEVPPAAKPGRYEFEVSSAGGKTIVPFDILAPLDAKTNFRGVTSDDVVYLIMTDRFADGDPSNNKDVDRRNPRAWHGGDFRGLTAKIPYLKELGVTAIWLTPWYDNPDEANECDKPWCPNTNYHGYHAIDYYAVENHFGTFADLREMVDAAHENGIKVIQDQVANHVGVQHPWAKQAPLENWFSKYSPNTFNNSVLLSPNASQAERDNLLKGWFNELLPDLNQDEPEVARYEIQNALWWIGATGIDGIRQDTIQYMPRKFIRDWSAAILKQYPRFWMVGEVFEEDSAQTAFFQGGRAGWDGVDTRLPSVFDFKLWRTSQEVFTGRKPARALRDVLKYDALYLNVNNLTLLANNHDTDRFMSLKGATKEGAKLHIAFILATRGIPQLYAGEEILMEGGHDPDNRRDFPGGWNGDDRNSFTTAGRNKDEREMFEWTTRWINLRRQNRAVREGKTIDLFYDEDAYVFVRDSVCKPICDLPVVFAFNSSGKEKVIEIASADYLPLDGQKDGSGVIRTYLEGFLETTTDKIRPVNGKFKLSLKPRSAVVYRGGFDKNVSTLEME
ncbi:MAG TPA: alpha-amylase family glycosyl hydrolase [Pyrinomonadaceae bacterium]|jgi:glycosidase